MITGPSTAETFTDDERRRLAPYFTNTDGHVFALTNLPETVKGALFARYSRSAKSLRRLFLDEFHGQTSTARSSAPTSRGRQRTRRTSCTRACFNEYGDDSVAQLGGAHIACEGVSNVLTKVLEWGRLMAYLEQSTRYVPYTDRLHGRWRYHVPAEIGDGAAARALRRGRWTRRSRPTRAGSRRCRRTSARGIPKAPEDSDGVHRVGDPRQGARHAARPAAGGDQSNVGIYGTGQAFEALLLRMRAHPLEEVRDCADADARRAAQGDPGVPRARRSAGPRRPLESSTSPTTRRDVRRRRRAARRRRRRRSRATR